MNEIKILGKQEFMGIEIQVIEGGFGDGKRIITVDTICKIHETRTDKINELINNNIDEFEEGIDIIDLMKNENSLNLAKGLGLITNNRQKYCYILSEQGYMLLSGFMKTDKAKEVRKRFRREYFAMREIINSDEQLLANLCLQLYKGGQDAVIASQKITEIEVSKATQPLLKDISNKKEIIHKQENEIYHKEDVIIGLTKEISLAEKRQRITQIIRHNSKKYQERYNLLYEEFNKKFHVDISRRLENSKERGEIKKSVNKMEYICSEKYMNMTNELYDLACKLFEGDFIQLLDEWKETVSK